MTTPPMDPNGASSWDGDLGVDEQSVDDLRRERDHYKGEVQRVLAKMAMLEAAMKRRDREIAQMKEAEARVAHDRTQLSVDAARLSAEEARRRSEVQHLHVDRAQAQLETANRFAAVATQWQQIEDELRREILRQRAEIGSLSAELAKSTYELDQRTRERHRLREILDKAHDAIFIIDLSTGVFADANAIGCRWIGRSRDELRRLRVTDVGLDLTVDVADPRAIQSDHPILCTGAIRGPDGTPRAVQATLTHCRFDVRAYVLLVVRDVTGLL